MSLNAKNKLKELKASFEELDFRDPLVLLDKAYAKFDSKICLASSFSLEDAVLIDIIAQLGNKVDVFALDTGRLNEQTFIAAEKISAKYNFEIKWFFPRAESIENLVSTKGLYSFRESVENRKECCAVRKLEPLSRALSGYQAWITGQRKEQSVTRASLSEIEIDDANKMIKFNPLASWSFEKVREYVEKKNIPYNQLYDEGYTSIGCAPCTRAIKIGESQRAGRWWWELSEHKECGLHFSNNLSEQEL